MVAANKDVRAVTYVLCALIAGSCGGDRFGVPRVVDASVQFPDYGGLPVDSLQAELISDDAEIRTPWSIQAADRYVFVQDAAGNPAVFALDIESGRIESRYGVHSDDDIRLGMVATMSRGWPSDSIWIYDAMNQQLLRVGGGESVQDSPVVLQLRGGATAEEVAWVAPFGYVALSRSTNRRISVVRFEGDMSFALDVSLPGSGNVSLFHRLRAARGAGVCVRPDGEMFALAYSALDRIEIFDLDSQQMLPADLPFRSDVDFPVAASEGASYFAPVRSWYLDCSASERKLYALAGGRRFLDSGFAEHGHYVHVFNWKGGLTGILQLDVPVRGISVDESESFLYAVSAERRGVYRFPLR